MTKLLGISLILLLPFPTASFFTACDSENIDTPIAFKDGDYLIAGIFNIGRVYLILLYLILYYIMSKW